MIAGGDTMIIIDRIENVGVSVSRKYETLIEHEHCKIKFRENIVDISIKMYVTKNNSTRPVKSLNAKIELYIWLGRKKKIERKKSYIYKLILGFLVTNRPIGCSADFVYFRFALNNSEGGRQYRFVPSDFNTTTEFSSSNSWSFKSFSVGRFSSRFSIGAPRFKKNQSRGFVYREDTEFPRPYLQGNGTLGAHTIRIIPVIVRNYNFRRVDSTGVVFFFYFFFKY